MFEIPNWDQYYNTILSYRVDCGAAKRRKRFRRFDRPDLLQRLDEALDIAAVIFGADELDVRVFSRLGQGGDHVELTVQIEDLLGDVSDFNLVL